MNKYNVAIGFAVFLAMFGILAASGPHGFVGKALIFGMLIFTAVTLRMKKTRCRL
ncbi:hypothetical protein JK203_04065 [Gluconobacter cerinus]|uniref:hypothetical protein n=1 Tax=Gluconobacter cerinus TaxID=38307 RepID=UPI001B8BBD9E|nr:hypothetical protein [Gluconobacter cerinus]MBS1040023.1 hypothetical protein [Gluconobacter cerinus]MBS1047010.1 hypothetical protein [Gluconobacter cerinus]